MSDKTHRLTLGKHTEDVTEQELTAVKALAGRNFSEYAVKEIQPKAPAELAEKPKKAEKPEKAEKAE